MENRLPDTQLPIQQQDATQQQKIVEPFLITVMKQEKGPNKIILALFGVVIFFLSAFLGYVFLLNFSKTQSLLQHSIARPLIASASPIPTLLFEATKQTKVATTLEVPDLYKSWIWSEEQLSSNESLTEIMADRFNKKYISIPFQKGKMYTATSSVISNPDSHLISNYYGIQLMKAGWVTTEGSAQYLRFQSFRLRANIADGPCSGIESFIGYKDGMVRLVSVSHSVQQCTSSTEVQKNSVLTRNIAYTVFISDPVSVRSLSDYALSHMKE